MKMEHLKTIQLFLMHLKVVPSFLLLRRYTITAKTTIKKVKKLSLHLKAST